MSDKKVIKKFYNPEPLEIEVQTVTGENTTLIMLDFTYEKSKQLSDAVDTSTKNKEDGATMLNRQCAVLFGGDHKDYQKYDPRVVRAIIDYVTENLRNPQGVTRG